MKNIYQTLFLIFFLFINTILNAQITQNAFDFDGTDDYITVPNASSWIANKDLSISFWVYPTNPTPAYPDFDGFGGFRNNTNADFYILHLNTNTVEARFRNSNGTNFDILYSGLVLNAWNHFVMTYTGTEFILYHNGTLAGSIVANGNITTSNEPLSIGYTPFNSPNFYLDGRLDDFALWEKGLSGAEVTTLYTQCNMDTSANGLVLCYEFDQGIPGGNNSGLTTITDSKGNMNGTLNSATLSGSSSNFVANPRNGTATYNIATCGQSSYTSASGNQVWTASGTYLDTVSNGVACDSFITVNLTLGQSSSSNISWSACNSYTSPSGNNTWTTSGVYTDVISNWQGCDSTITINLSINGPSTGNLTVSACENYTSPSGSFVWTQTGTYADLTQNQFGCDSTITVNLTIYDKPDTAVVQNFGVLTAIDSTLTYQWLDCDNGYAQVAGATSQSFQATVNGNYAVELTNGLCVDTSACFNVTNVSTHAPFIEPIVIYPNPTTGQFMIDLGMSYRDVSIKITNVIGQVVQTQLFNELQQLEFDMKQPSGIYFIEIQSEEKREVIKLVKE